jgi:hypothetical protein
MTNLLFILLRANRAERYGLRLVLSYQFPQPTEHFGKLVSHRPESEPEMRRSIETISRRDQNASFRGGLAKSATVLSTSKPGKCGHFRRAEEPSQVWRSVLS